MAKKTIQNRILKDIWREKGKTTPKKIVENTELRITQVYEALRNLKRRRLITIIKKPITEVGYKKPPKNEIEVVLNEKQIKRIRRLLKIDK